MAADKAEFKPLGPRVDIVGYRACLHLHLLKAVINLDSAGNTVKLGTDWCDCPAASGAQEMKNMRSEAENRDLNINLSIKCKFSSFQCIGSLCYQNVLLILVNITILYEEMYVILSS